MVQNRKAGQEIEKTNKQLVSPRDHHSPQLPFTFSPCRRLPQFLFQSFPLAFLPFFLSKDRRNVTQNID